jgi:hypothetical protein
VLRPFEKGKYTSTKNIMHTTCLPTLTLTLSLSLSLPCIVACMTNQIHTACLTAGHPVPPHHTAPPSPPPLLPLFYLLLRYPAPLPPLPLESFSPHSGSQTSTHCPHHSHHSTTEGPPAVALSRSSPAKPASHRGGGGEDDAINGKMRHEKFGVCSMYRQTWIMQHWTM